MAKGGAATAKKRAAVEATIVDEFDFQPGELSQEDVIKRLGFKGVRSVQELTAEGRLPMIKKRRRSSNGDLRSRPVYMADDVEKLKAEIEAGTEPDRASANALVPARGKIGGDAQAMFMAMLDRVVPGENAGARATFLSVEDAAAEYELSPAGIKQMIADKVLTRYPGKNGRAMVSRRQIENL